MLIILIIKQEMLYSLILTLKKVNDIIFLHRITYNKSILKTLLEKKILFIFSIEFLEKGMEKRKKSIIMDAEDLKVSKKIFL